MHTSPTAWKNAANPICHAGNALRRYRESVTERTQPHAPGIPSNTAQTPTTPARRMCNHTTVLILGGKCTLLRHFLQSYPLSPEHLTRGTTTGIGLIGLTSAGSMTWGVQQGGAKCPGCGRQKTKPASTGERVLKGYIPLLRLAKTCTGRCCFPTHGPQLLTALC